MTQIPHPKGLGRFGSPLQRLDYPFSQEYLREIFLWNYTLGTLLRIERPLHHFQGDVARWNCYNSQQAGRIAGVMNANGLRKLTIDGINVSACAIVWCLENGEYPYIRQKYSPLWTDPTIHLPLGRKLNWRGRIRRDGHAV